MKESPYLKCSQSIIQRFQELPLFQTLEPRFLKKILEQSKIRKFETGEIITQEGLEDSGVYIIISGGVDITKKGKKIASLEQPGDTFGELALIDGKTRSATVKTSKETVCLAVDAFLEGRNYTEKDQHAFYAVMYRLFSEILANRLRKTSDELADAKKEIEKLKDDMAW